MNSLNSVMIEGTVTRKNAAETTAEGNKRILLFIEVNRFYRVEGSKKLAKETSTICVESWARTADRVESGIEPGQTVRVVGRLKQEKTVGQIIVVAEHVEIKLSKKASVNV